MELRIGYNTQNTDSYEYVTPQDIKDLFDSGKLTFDIPKYDRYPSKYDNFIENFIQSIDRDIKFANKDDAREIRKRISVADDFEPSNNEMLWLSDMVTYKDPVTGNDFGWVYFNYKTNTVSIHHYDTKEKFITQAVLSEEETNIVEIDIPSGKLVFGYYSMFEPFEDQDARDAEYDDRYVDYFDSEHGRRNFNKFYQEKNIAMFYQGYFTISQNVKGMNDSLTFVENYNDEYPNPLSRIEHDKASSFMCLDTLLSRVEKDKNNGIEHTFQNSRYKDTPLTKENLIEEANQDNIFKQLDIIEVPKGRYRITLFKKGVNHIKPNCPEEMKEYGENLDYTTVGNMELIKEF